MSNAAPNLDRLLSLFGQDTGVTWKRVAMKAMHGERAIGILVDIALFSCMSAFPGL